MIVQTSVKYSEFAKNFVNAANSILSNEDPLLLTANMFKKSLIKGIYIEYGVFKGHTIKAASQILPQVWTLYGFDSFEGLPEFWRKGFNKGSFSLQGNQPNIVDKNIVLIKGLFQDTLPSFIQNKNFDFADIIHVDCDLYSSSKFVLFQSDSIINNQTYLVFDELINYPDYINHELKALYEYSQYKHCDIEIVYAGGYNKEKVCIKLK